MAWGYMSSKEKKSSALAIAALIGWAFFGLDIGLLYQILDNGPNGITSQRIDA